MIVEKRRALRPQLIVATLVLLVTVPVLFSQGDTPWMVAFVACGLHSIVAPVLAPRQSARSGTSPWISVGLVFASHVLFMVFLLFGHWLRRTGAEDGRLGEGATIFFLLYPPWALALTLFFCAVVAHDSVGCEGV